MSWCDNEKIPKIEIVVAVRSKHVTHVVISSDYINDIQKDGWMDTYSIYR